MNDVCTHGRVDAVDLGEKVFVLKEITCRDCGHTWREAKDPPSRPSGFRGPESPTVAEPHAR